MILVILIVILVVIASLIRRRRGAENKSDQPSPDPIPGSYIIHSSDPGTERREREIAELRILLEKERAERSDLARQVEELKSTKNDDGSKN